MKVISVKKFTRLDKNIILVFSAALSGIITGICLYLLSDDASKSAVNDLFIAFKDVFSQKSFAELFTALSVSCLIFHAVMFICGSSLFGKPVCALLILFKMTGISTIITHVISAYSIKGLEYILLSFLPGKAFFILSLIFLGKNCFDMIDEIKKIPLYNKNTQSGIKIYCIKSAVACVISLAYLIIDSFCFRLFGGMLDR